MGKMSEVETPTAIKPHRCEWCWQTIATGEQYRRYRYWSEGDAGTVKLHAECFDAMKDDVAKEGGWIEWTPGSGERPNAIGQGSAACGASPAPTGCASNRSTE